MAKAQNRKSAVAVRPFASGPGGPQRPSGVRNASDPATSPNSSDPRILGLLTDLQTQQIELELQNDELRETHQELVRARDELADLYERAPVGYVTTNHMGSVLAANLRFAALVGQERAAMVGRPLGELIVWDDRNVYQLHRQALRDGVTRHACELRMLGARGKIFWATLESVVVWRPEGISHVRSAVSDITERKEAEQEKCRLKECLQQSQKMEAIGTLAGGVAHDVNNILAVILALGSRLERHLPESDGSRQDVRDIVSAVYRGKKLTQDLLDFARRGPRRNEVCSANDAIARLIAVLERTAPKRIAIQAALDEQTACIECDPAQLTQMLMNICLNSIDAITNQGTITIATGNVLPGDAEFSREPELPSVPYVRIEIADDGTGMDAETQRRAFEPFFTTKDVGKGTGLGLSMVYGAVQELGGVVRIASELNVGTTVRMVLPASPAARARRSSFPARAGVNVPGGVVLVVDDEPLVRRSFARMLEDLGYRVIVADGGPSALELYREKADQIDVVLLDLAMPVMDGAECYAQLRQIDPGVRVVLCTGHPRGEGAQQLIAQDALRLVAKPCSPEELATALSEAVQLAPRILHLS